MEWPKLRPEIYIIYIWSIKYKLSLNCPNITSILVGYIIISGSGTFVVIALCGNTLAPFKYSSSFTTTSSPITQVFSIRTHSPIEHYKTIKAFITLRGYMLDSFIEILLIHLFLIKHQRITFLPTILLLIQEWVRTMLSDKMVQWRKQTPFSIFTRGPITTLGPKQRTEPGKSTAIET